MGSRRLCRVPVRFGADLLACLVSRRRRVVSYFRQHLVLLVGVD
jgi:hypothetical protein